MYSSEVSIEVAYIIVTTPVGHFLYWDVPALHQLGSPSHFRLS
ncbi:MAG TPA: hypothetical protein VN946_05980 [Terriglobales bacterium]|nr:hypothetical protein [Terriglobales bacterium]